MFHGPFDTLKRVADQPQSSIERARRWETLYVGHDPTLLSWYQEEPTLSLELLDLLDVAVNTAVIDVGGGASRLVDRLLARGFSDVTVLDQSPTALEVSRERVSEIGPANWIAHDLLSWHPTRRYGLWHDRAAFHFFTGAEIDAYLGLLDRTLASDGAVILGTFAPDGPQYCSGFPTHRYDAGELVSLLGVTFEVVAQRREIHYTPEGVAQPFTWVAARRTTD